MKSGRMQKVSTQRAFNKVFAHEKHISVKDLTSSVGPSMTASLQCHAVKASALLKHCKLDTFSSKAEITSALS